MNRIGWFNRRMKLSLFGGSKPFNLTDLPAGYSNWDGSDIAHLFQDAAKTTPVVNTGDLIGNIVDVGTNGYDGTNSGAGRPAYTTNAINGKAAMLFSGAQRLQTALAGNLTDFACFVVFQKISTPLSYERLVDKKWADAFFMARNSTNAHQWGGDFRDVTVPTLFLKDGDPHVMGLTRNGTVLKQFADGNVRQTYTVTANPMVNSRAMRFGSDDASGGFFNGYIGQIVFCPYAVTDIVAKQLENLLLKNWNFTIPTNRQIACFQTNGTNRLIIHGGAGPSLTSPTFTTPVYAADTITAPSITKVGSTYWVTYTDGSLAGNNKSFGVLSSPDLVNWTLVCKKDCTTGGIAFNRVWASEWFIDTNGTPYILFAGSIDAGVHFAFYYSTPTAVDWSTWSDPVLITTTNFPNSYFDPYIIKVGSTYYMFYHSADSGNGGIAYGTSTSPVSGYTKVKDPNYGGWGTGAEAACVVLLPNGSYRMYYDNTGQYYSDSADLFQTWSAGVAVQHPAVTHGTWITDAIP